MLGLPSLRWVLALVAAVLAWLPGMSASAQGDDPYARLVVIANFDATEVQINGVAYPYEWIHGDMEGVLLPANRRLEIIVSASPEQRRTFRLTLDPNETRYLVVDIENMGGRNASPVARRAAVTAEAAVEEEPPDEMGTLGVSSSPRGVVYVDGADTGERTPARRIAVSPGRHEVQVYYDEEEIMSETKHVLIRAGVNTNVFFRLRREQLEAASEVDED